MYFESRYFESKYARFSQQPFARTALACCFAALLTTAMAARADDDLLDPGPGGVTAPTQGFDHRTRRSDVPENALIYVNSPASEPDNIPSGTAAFTHVVDARTLRVIKKVAVEEKPHHFYKVPHENKAYISHFGGSKHIEVMDLLANEIVAKIAVDDGPRHLSFSEDGKKVWSANLDQNSVSLIDVKNDKVIWTSPAGPKPNYVNPAWSYVFTANYGGSTLTVLDALTGAHVSEIGVGGKPFNIAVSCDERLVMSANAGSNDVSFIDVGTLSEVARVSIMGPISQAQLDTSVTQRLNPRISPDCKYLWVGNQAAGVFAVLNIADRQLVAEVRAAEKGGGSDIVFFIPDGPAKGMAIGTNRYSEFATVIDPNTFKPLKRIPAGKGTHYVTFNEGFTTAYVSSRLAGSFSVYDMATLKEVARKPGFNQLDQAVYMSFNRKLRASSVSESGDLK